MDPMTLSDLNAVNNDDVVLVVVRRTSDNEVLGERRR
jgi:hypothetical protein